MFKKASWAVVVLLGLVGLGRAADPVIVSMDNITLHNDNSITGRVVVSVPMTSPYYNDNLPSNCAWVTLYRSGVFGSTNYWAPSQDVSLAFDHNANGVLDVYYGWFTYSAGFVPKGSYQAIAFAEPGMVRYCSDAADSDAVISITSDNGTFDNQAIVLWTVNGWHNPNPWNDGGTFRGQAACSTTSSLSSVSSFAFPIGGGQVFYGLETATGKNGNYTCTWSLVPFVGKNYMVTTAFQTEDGNFWSDTLRELDN